MSEYRFVVEGQSLASEYEVRRVQSSDIVDHLPRLHAEASRPGVKVIELGVRSGNSTAAFLAAADACDGHVWSVDTDWASLPEEWYRSGRWSYVIGDDCDPTVVAGLPDGVDVVFIDTSHHYAHTLRELAVYVPKVRPGGVVLLHDTELDAPYAAPADDPVFPVAAAIRRYTGERGLTVEWVEGCYGLGVIHIGGAS